jgi:exonuclease III
MNILCWNCRGAGGPEKIQFLKDLLRSTRVDIAFINETRSGVRRAVRQLHRIQGYNWHMVPSEVFLGGLWLFWSASVKLSVIEAEKQFIFAHISAPEGDWVLAAIYGDASHRESPRLWGKIESYADTSYAPLCCIGDFNAILTLSEKHGGSTRLNNNNKSFRDLIFRADLIDLGFSGPAFTWTNSSYTSRPIFKRLDRVVVSTTWQAMYLRSHVKHLPMIYSDHTPILLMTTPPTRKKLVFRMEHWWMRLPNFEKECKRLWDLTEGPLWEERQHSLGKGLQKWAREYPLPERRLKELEN